MTVSPILIFAFIAFLALMFFQPRQVVVVRERDTPEGCMRGMFMLIFLIVVLIVIGSVIMLEGPADKRLPVEPDKSEKQSEKVKESAEPLRNQAPPASQQQDTRPDTLINMAPPRRSAQYSSQNEPAAPAAPESGNGREIYMPAGRQLLVVLVKRFASLDQAFRLQQHFSRWGMEVLEVEADEKSYWNCVPVRSPEEGYQKIRQWNRHRRDFDHMDLEFTVTQITVH